MKAKRYVNVDMGYGPAEHWERARVIQSQMVGQLFSDEPKESLLVELLSGERTWVDYWTEDKAEEVK